MKYKMASFIGYHKNSLINNSKKRKFILNFWNMLNFKPKVYIILHACMNTIDLFASLLLTQRPSKTQSFALVLYTIFLTAEITRNSTTHLATKP